MRKCPHLAIACLALAVSSQAHAGLTGYEFLADWNQLPLAKIRRQAGLASSYDRAGVNQDYNYYESPEGFQTGAIATTIKTLTGPGIITRFWMPHLTADMAYTVRMIVDGQVRIDTDSDTFLAGQYDEPNGYIRSPLVQTLIGGQVSYEPIVFQDSLVIESNNQGSGEYSGQRHYYQYSYHRLSAGTAVTSYTGTLTGQQQAARNGVVNMISNVGQNPAGASCRIPDTTAASGPVERRSDAHAG